MDELWSWLHALGDADRSAELRRLVQPLSYFVANNAVCLARADTKRAVPTTARIAANTIASAPTISSAGPTGESLSAIAPPAANPSDVRR